MTGAIDKVCAKCKHYSQHFIYQKVVNGDVEKLVKVEQSLCARLLWVRDKVTGEVKSNAHLNCATERKVGACGSEGKFFEHKV